MRIEEHIADHLRKRLESVSSLIIYDPPGRYAGIARDLEASECIVVDGSSSTILGRESTEEAFLELASSDKKRLVIYLPVSAPRTNEEKQRNPYQAYAIAGGEFPEGDGESFHVMCRQAVPDRVEAVDELFAAGIPDFETINNLIAGSTNWPKLKTILGAESAVEILSAFLSPDEEQEAKLKSDDTWVSEMISFLAMTLDLKLQTKSKKRAGIAAEVWRYALFSEFVFDLPVELPEALRDVPRASKTQETLIYSVCDNLRSVEKHQIRYMEAAGKVAESLQLLKHAAGITELGNRDTFAFEERIYLRVFTEAAMKGDYAKAGEVSNVRNNSIWVNRIGERRQLWTIADRALQLITKSGDLETRITVSCKSVSSTIDFYCNEFRLLDLMHRGFEQAVTDVYGEFDDTEVLVAVARAAYRKTAEKLQSIFLDAVADEGWPASGRRGNTDVFDAFVAPWIKERKKTAYFLVDALRYELAVEVQNELAGSYDVSLEAVCAQLPSVTPVGMAALMPGAAGKLTIKCEKGKVVPYIGDQKVVVPNDRFSHIQSIYGDLCHMRSLDQLVSKSKIKIPDNVQLLIIKTADIDMFGEANAMEARHMLPRLIQKLIAGVRKAAKLGFEKAVLATDHGFVLLDELGAGNVTQKPSGDWEVEKGRCLLGKGSSGPGVLTFSPDEIGINADFETYAVPKALGTFCRGNPYFHAGLSLQECVLPVLSVNLVTSQESDAESVPEIKLSYKGDAGGKITTLRPMIEISLFKTGFFEEAIELRLDAYDGKTLVGEASSCSNVNSSTGLVSLQPGEAIKVPLRMDEDYSGSFEVRAVDPVTNLTYAIMKLKTDYME